MVTRRRSYELRKRKNDKYLSKKNAGDKQSTKVRRKTLATRNQRRSKRDSDEIRGRLKTSLKKSNAKKRITEESEDDSDYRPGDSSGEEESDVHVNRVSSPKNKILNNKKSKQRDMALKIKNRNDEKSKQRTNNKKNTGDHDSIESVADDVIFCGQKSVHCFNVGNVLFKNYVQAAVILDFKFEGNTRSRYDRKYSILEINEKLKHHEWRKLGADNEQLTEEEIELKIRKSVNDRIRKNRMAFNKKMENVPKRRLKIERDKYLQKLCEKLVVVLDYFEELNFYPQTGIADDDVEAEVVIDDNINVDSVLTENMEEELSDRKITATYSEDESLSSDEISNDSSSDTDGSKEISSDDLRSIAGLKLPLKDTKKQSRDTLKKGRTGAHNENNSAWIVSERPGNFKSNESNSNDVRLKGVVVGEDLNIRIFEDYSDAPDGNVLFEMNESENDFSEITRNTMELLLLLLEKTEKEQLKVQSVKDVVKNYKERKPSFSILAPAKEKIRIKICHGSHRINYGELSDGNYNTVHRKMVTDVYVPENCMIIMDEKLLHAGSESLLCGYAPTFSPRYFSYLHHKDKIADRNCSYSEVEYCDDDCMYCSDDRAIDGNRVLVRGLTNLGRCFATRDAEREQNDLIAGDLNVLGWIIVRNGIRMTATMEQRLAHEFQTILLTKKFTVESLNSAWHSIGSKKDKKQRTIPDTFRAYMFEENDRLQFGIWIKKDLAILRTYCRKSLELVQVQSL